jgi:tetratricopeptide (TPR) repeat protein
MASKPCRFVFSALLLIPFAAISEGYQACGSLDNGYGPFDYRSTETAKIEIVEKFHFPPKVETLRGGSTASTPGGDLAYTLKAFPNHPRALMATVRFSEKTKQDPPPEMIYTVNCWFDRAERFRPDDATVQLLYGLHLVRIGNSKDGITKLESALSLSGDDPNILYNLGLAYFELKQFDKSLEYAKQAYSLGFPLPGLKNKLLKAGKWKDEP